MTRKASWHGSKNGKALQKPTQYHSTKYKGEENDEHFLHQEDFMVVVQSPIQKRMLQQFGAKVVCVDSTDGTTGYNFNLTTLMIIDEFGSGFPVAWCLSNHEDTTFMTLFST